MYSRFGGFDIARELEDACDVTGSIASVFDGLLRGPLLGKPWQNRPFMPVKLGISIPGVTPEVGYDHYKFSKKTPLNGVNSLKIYKNRRIMGCFFMKKHPILFVYRLSISVTMT